MVQGTFETSVPADPRHLKTIRAFFESVLRDVEPGLGKRLVLALDESCANVLKHQPQSEGSRLCVRAEISPTQARFTIHDFCTAADVPSIKPRDLEEVRPGGLGTHFVSEIMDRVSFVPESDASGESGRLALVLEKNLEETVRDG